jgi:urease accessory protein UreE
VDVEARLAAKKKVEARYLELVAQAKTVTEVLEVERELGNVRAEIESMEGRMKVLRDQVAMSTLTITCTKPQARSDSFTPHVGVAVKEGWNNLLRFSWACFMSGPSCW